MMMGNNKIKPKKIKIWIKTRMTIKFKINLKIKSNFRIKMTIKTKMINRKITAKSKNIITIKT